MSGHCKVSAYQFSLGNGRGFMIVQVGGGGEGKLQRL